MNTKTLFAALAVSLVASTAAMAQEATYEYPQPSQSAKSRADVMAELKQAWADGSIRHSEQDRQQETPFVSARSRAEVRAETVAAMANPRWREQTSDSNAFHLSTLHASAQGGDAGQ